MYDLAKIVPQYKRVFPLPPFCTDGSDLQKDNLNMNPQYAVGGMEEEASLYERIEKGVLIYDNEAPND